MIKRLRVKFVCINMTLLTVLLLIILGLVCYFTATNLETEAEAALRGAADTIFRPDRPGDVSPEHLRPCFSLEKIPGGEMRVEGEEYFDLTDKQLLEEIYQAAQEDGRQIGRLPKYALRYYRVKTPMGERFVFTDTAADTQRMQGLITNCIVVGIMAVFGFFGISLSLASWAVRPVEKAWQQQRQFVADASHELKTPLTVILTNAELLRGQEYDALEKERFADSILTMSRQMRLLVESLLELARADKLEDKQEYTALDLSRIVEEAMLPFEPLYFENDRMLESTIEPGICVKGDARYLHQVVDVLLDNGVKYSDPGGATTLTLASQGKKAVLTVTTPGAPLTKEQCGELFKRFYRVDTARSRNGSYGLGLSIAQRIVENHGGKIWAQPTQAGNSFFVSLPTE